MTARREITFRTPEGVSFALPLAGPVSRMLAVIIDLAAIGAASGVIRQALGLLGVVSPALYQAVTMVALFAAGLGYPIACEWFWRGQTLGKRLLGLRVIDAEGRRVTFPQIVMRNLLRPVDMLPAFYLLGGASAWTSRHAQRLGDMAARTVVVRLEQLAQPDVEQLLGGKYNSLAEHRHLAARLRQRVPPALAGVALETLLRRNELDAAPRVRLFERIATHLRGLVQFPAADVEQLSDEQYVRNAVLVLFRTSSSASEVEATPGRYNRT
jgi:uncharacterized RDD family membrane protein YckC